MQTFYSFSDNAKAGLEYPFMKRKPISLFQWIIIYFTTPYSWYEALKWYYKHKYDKNCIKRHPKYMTGKMVGKITKPIALDKAKEVAKKMGITFNDLVLGLISKCIKHYFIAKGDESTYITMNVPYSFNVIPESVEDYRAENNITTLTVYLELEEDFEKAC